MTEENITRMSIAEIRANIAAGGDRTDWARVDAMTDEEIESAMRDDPDWKDHIDDDWSGAQLVSSTLQSRVQPWMMACFGAEIANDKLERGDRFIEEALELLQAADYPRDRIYQLIAYVYGRPKGEMHQEIGGVMITLAAFCLAHGYDMHHAGEQELERIWTKVEAIRAKQAAKPTGSALPVAVSGPVDIAAENARLLAALESLVQSGKQVDVIKIKPIDWKTDGRSMWEDADFPRHDLYRASSGGFWLAYADRTIRYSPNERDFPSEEAAKAAAQAHKEKRTFLAIDGGVDALRQVERDAAMFWEMRIAFRRFPKMPPPRVLKWVGGLHELDWERGKAIQRELGLAIIPPKSECETGAGFWDRITQGKWRDFFNHSEGGAA